MNNSLLGMTMISDVDVNKDPAPAIELKTYSPQAAAQFPLLGMIAAVTCVAVLFQVVFRNQWNGIWMAMIIIGVCAVVELLCKWILLRTLKTYRLFSDRLIINETELLHSKINSIHWPEKPTGDKLNLVINYRFAKTPELEDEPFILSLNELKQDDRLLLIQYLQQLKTKQLNWPEFGCRYLDRWLPVRSVRYVPQRMSDRLEKNPFWASFLFSPYIAFYCLAQVSSAVYFSFAAGLGISALINIRLMHGSWLSPIGEMVLATAALIFLFGVITYCFPQFKFPRDLEPADRKMGQQSIAVLVLDVIFAPLLCQLLLTMGWNLLAAVTMQVCAWLPCVPFVLHGIGRQRERKKDPEALAKGVAEKWSRYCEQADSLDEADEPYSNSAIHSGSFSTGKPTTVDSKPSTMRTQSSPSW